MLADLLLAWPRSYDYPKWRQFLRDNRNRFNKVIIAFTETNYGSDYRFFIQLATLLDNVEFINASQNTNADWRNLAVNEMLLHTNTPWLFFTEQDFYPLPGFWDEVQRLENDGCDVIAAYQATRMHPCCIFMTRAALNKTHRDFGIVPGVGDHFYRIQKDLENEGVKIGKINPGMYYHYNGLSHNMHLLEDGGTPNYEPERFTEWAKECLNVNVPIDDRFRALVSRIV